SLPELLGMADPSNMHMFASPLPYPTFGPPLPPIRLHSNHRPLALRSTGARRRFGGSAASVLQHSLTPPAYLQLALPHSTRHVLAMSPVASRKRPRRRSRKSGRKAGGSLPSAPPSSVRSSRQQLRTAAFTLAAALPSVASCRKHLFGS